MKLLDPSPDATLCSHLVDEYGRSGAHRELELLLAKFTVVELAALATHWPLWARPKQLAPTGAWHSWLFLTSRGWGKTTTIAHHIVGEVQAGRAMSIGLAAQNETKTIEVQVVSLIRASPPWFRPEWITSTLKLVWPNGAIAFARSPEVPGAIRSENHHISWLSEVQSWPASTQEEAWSNFDFATRVGYSRMIIDATPKRAHPILKRLLARAAADPTRHVAVRGTVHENPHIPRAVVDRWFAEYGGTQKGREELLGEMLEESDAALVKQAWIDKARRPMPVTLVRRAIGVDPAVTNRAGNDSTGIVLDGLGVDGQLYVLGDFSGKHSADAWAKLVLDHYVDDGCDCVVVETNKGGDLVVQNLRAHADRRKLSVVVLGKDEPARVSSGVVYVRERYARGAKEDRAQPLATAYERGRVSHVVGVDLTELETILTTWEPKPGVRSPDALDAHVHVAVELMGLAGVQVDAGSSFRGILDVASALSGTRPASANLAALLGRGSSGAGRI